MKRTNQTTRRLGVLIYFNQDYGRRVLAGVLQYADAAAAVEVEVLHSDILKSDAGKRRQAFGSLDGLVAVVDYCELPRVRPYTLIPVAATPRYRGQYDGLTVAPDPYAIGMLGAQHLLSLRLTHFTVCGSNPMATAPTLVAGFRDTLLAAGFQPLPVEQLPEFDSERLATWLSCAPKPIGILCQSDVYAATLLRAIAHLGLRVPDDIAVLGVGDDPIVCMPRQISLSSIAVSPERVGWHAANALLRILNGEEAASQTIPPVGVVQRRSTQTIVLDDAPVAEAACFMRSQFAQPLSIADVSAHVGVPRRTLERRFTRAMGHSMHAEMVRCRLEKAGRLLATTALPVKAVAFAVGENNPHHFSRFFKKHTGLSPRLYRQQHTLDGPRWPIGVCFPELPDNSAAGPREGSDF